MPLQRYVTENEDRIDPSAIRNFKGATPIELRPIDPDRYFKRRSDGPRAYWFRVAGAAGSADVASRCPDEASPLPGGPPSSGVMPDPERARIYGAPHLTAVAARGGRASR